MFGETLARAREDARKATIKWVYGGEQGFWESDCGRFRIEPIYSSSTRPWAYKVYDHHNRDRLTAKPREVMCDTVKGAKRQALLWRRLL